MTTRQIEKAVMVLQILVGNVNMGKITIVADDNIGGPPYINLFIIRYWRLIMQAKKYARMVSFLMR